jgi:hypothetical protein
MTEDKKPVGHRKLAKHRKDAQVMTRMRDRDATRLHQIALEQGTSASWILNKLAVEFIREHDAAKPQ